MTFKDIFGSAMSHPTSSNYYKDYHRVGNSQPVMSEREGIGYGYGYTKSKPGYKMDKKHAAMSALTLLAFLFFLNILQNCLKEQIQPFASDVTMMMIMPAKQIKGSSQRKNDENPWQAEKRKTRSLLELKGNQEESTTETVTRRMKFIHDLKDVNRKWKNALTQLTDKELENQRIKTDNLQLYLRKFRTTGTERNNPMEAEKLIPVTTTNGKLRVGNAKKPETSSFNAKYTAKAFVKTLNDKKNFGGEMETADDWIPSTGLPYFERNGTYNTTSRNNRNNIWANYKRLKKGLIKNHKMDVDNGRRTFESYGEGSTQIARETQNTSSIGLDLKTYQNHKYSPNPYWENQTSATAMLTAIDGVVSTQEKNNAPRRPLFQNRFDHANHNRIYETSRPRQPMEFRYKYSPYSKTSNHRESSPGYHKEYHHPIGVISKYPQEDETGFDFIKFVWMMLSSFAKPLSKIVPSLSKVGSDESHCFNLLICEAHRVSRLMGSTAESLASTFSTLVIWYAAEENRRNIINAVSSGKENTCQQQIWDCDERSGGKSAMTVLAQALETKIK